MLWETLAGIHRAIKTPLDPKHVPEMVPVLELIEWLFQQVSKATWARPHECYGALHYQTFSKEPGQAYFAEKINELFRRSDLAFELDAQTGEVSRILPPVLADALSSATFRTEDSELNRLLESARKKFKDPAFHVRYDALKDLFDAFERTEDTGTALQKAPGRPSPHREGGA